MTVIAPEAPVEDLVDTSDLDLLDDAGNHAFCGRCNGYASLSDVKRGDVVTAVCSARGLVGLGAPGIAAMDDPCQAAFLRQVCPMHGYVGPGSSS